MNTTRLTILEFRRGWHEGVMYTIKKQMDALRQQLEKHHNAIDLVNEQIDTLQQEES